MSKEGYAAIGFVFGAAVMYYYIQQKLRNYVGGLIDMSTLGVPWG